MTHKHANKRQTARQRPKTIHNVYNTRRTIKYSKTHKNADALIYVEVVHQIILLCIIQTHRKDFLYVANHSVKRG